MSTPKHVYNFGDGKAEGGAAMKNVILIGAGCGRAMAEFLCTLGVPVLTTWQGIDLLPALTGRENLPRLAAFSQHLTAGPMRTAAVRPGAPGVRSPFETANAIPSTYVWKNVSPADDDSCSTNHA